MSSEKSDLSKSLVIAISSRALFDLKNKENEIFNSKGEDFYCQYQRDHENDILTPGAGFPLIRSFLELNKQTENISSVEVIVISRNNLDTGIRIFNSIKHYGLGINRGVFTSGAPASNYLRAFHVDLFLSAKEEDVRHSLDSGFAAGLIYETSKASDAPLEEIRIAFDGDAVLFSDESEQIYQEHGLDAFITHETENASRPLERGPFASFLHTLSGVQSQFKGDSCPIRTALVTARSSPSHERVIKTLREWNVRIDEAFFMGGLSKEKVLQSFKPHIFFDDHPTHCDEAAKSVSTARVPSDLKKRVNC